MKKISLLILLCFTGFLVWPLLAFVGYTANMGSLAPATLIMARRVASDGIFGWYANWYLGFPFRFAGPPAAWWVLGGIEKIWSGNLLFFYRLFFAVSLISFPVSFYFLARRVFGGFGTGPVTTFPPASAHSKFDVGANSPKSVELRAVGSLSSRATRSTADLVAFVSSLFLILLPSAGYVFPGFFKAGERWGFAPSWMLVDGLSRMMGLALLPILLVLYWRLLEKISFPRLLACILATSALFLMDGVSSLSLLSGIAVILTIAGHRGNLAQKSTVAALSLVLAFLVDAFWFTPANIKLIAISPSISGVGLGSFIKTMVQAGVGFGPALLAVVWLRLLSKGKQAQGFVLLWLLPFVSITLLFYFSNPDFLTEYTRFMPEVEMGVALLLGWWVSWLAGRWVKGQIFRQNSAQLVVLIALFVTLIYSLYQIPRKWSIFRPQPFFNQTIEYKTAKWLEKETINNKQKTGNLSRVFLSGSTAFWLGEFAPAIWQVRGDIDQASTNPFWARATYQIRNGNDVEESILWLRALRVGYFVVHDQNSREYYHDFANPGKFDVCQSEQAGHVGSSSHSTSSADTNPVDYLYRPLGLRALSGTLSVAVTRNQPESTGPVISFPPVHGEIIQGEPVSAQSSKSSQPFPSFSSEALRTVKEAPFSRATDATRSGCYLVFDSREGDRIYSVKSNIANVARKADFANLPVPVKGKEKTALESYVWWLEAGEPAYIEEQDSGDLRLTAETAADQIISVGITYDRGWQAKDLRGAKLKTSRDVFGNLVIFPINPGKQEITLSFREGFDLWVGFAVCLGTLIFIFLILPKKLPTILKWSARGWGEDEED